MRNSATPITWTYMFENICKYGNVHINLQLENYVDQCMLQCKKKSYWYNHLVNNYWQSQGDPQTLCHRVEPLHSPPRSAGVTTHPPGRVWRSVHTEIDPHDLPFPPSTRQTHLSFNVCTAGPEVTIPSSAWRVSSRQSQFRGGPHLRSLSTNRSSAWRVSLQYLSLSPGGVVAPPVRRLQGMEDIEGWRRTSRVFCSHREPSHSDRRRGRCHGNGRRLSNRDGWY